MTSPDQAADPQHETAARNGLDTVSWGIESRQDGLERDVNPWREELSERLDKLRGGRVGGKSLIRELPSTWTLVMFANEAVAN